MLRDQFKKRPTKPLILIVDDSPLQGKLFELVGETMCFDAQVVRSAGEAFLAMERTDFDLILMDWMLPDIDGLQCTKLIRQVEAETGAHIPIIAVTGRCEIGDREQCLAAGMDDYVPKPFTMDELGKVILLWLAWRDENRFNADASSVQASANIAS